MPSPSKGIPVTCERCDCAFEAAASMRGGVAACPKCRSAVAVKGGFEPLFWALVGGGLTVVALAALGVASASGSVWAGIGTFAFGAAITGVIVSSS